MLHTDEESYGSDFSSLDEFDVKGGYLENISGVDHNQAVTWNMRMTILYPPTIRMEVT